MKALGIGWVRYDVEWSNVEREGPGKYDWAPYDRIVAAARSRGLQSLAILDYTPTWARRPECADSQMCAPRDPQAYGRFAAAAAARYEPQGVHHWEIWNEPNSRDFFKPAANAEQYTQLLKAASTAIKRVDPDAVVITGGTSPADTGGGYLSPPDFARGLYEAGARGSFDAMAHHPYTFPVTASYPNPDNAWGQLKDIHEIMVARGDSSKQLWITEYGSPTGGPGPAASSNAYVPGAWHVSEAMQSLAVADAVRTYRTYPWAGPFFWYSFQDAGTSRDSSENFFGLVRADGSRKPAYETYRRLIQ